VCEFQQINYVEIKVKEASYYALYFAYPKGKKRDKTIPVDSCGDP
jgi:hypothetical protein